MSKLDEGTSGKGKNLLKRGKNGARTEETTWLTLSAVQRLSQKWKSWKIFLKENIFSGGPGGKNGSVSPFDPRAHPFPWRFPNTGHHPHGISLSSFHHTKGNFVYDVCVPSIKNWHIVRMKYLYVLARVLIYWVQWLCKNVKGFTHSPTRFSWKGKGDFERSIINPPPPNPPTRLLRGASVRKNSRKLCLKYVYFLDYVWCMCEHKNQPKTAVSSEL